MTSAVRPAALRVSCDSPAAQYTASPAATGWNAPSPPDTSPTPSSTASIWGTAAGCRRIAPPAASRKIAHCTELPARSGAVSGATVVRSSSGPASSRAASGPKRIRSTSSLPVVYSDSMPSRTQLLTWVKDWKAKDVAAGLAEDPKLLGYRDERGRNFLHVCCGVSVKQRGRQASHSLRTADVLLEAGLGLNQEAFREGTWKATPLWYAVARGQNLALAKHLLELGSDPNHCLWAACFNDDLAAIALLLDHGADIEAVAEGETP